MISFFNCNRIYCDKTVCGLFPFVPQYWNSIHHAGLHCHFHAVYGSLIIRSAMTDGSGGRDAFRVINFYSSRVTALVSQPFNKAVVNGNGWHQPVRQTALLHTIKCPLTFPLIFWFLFNTLFWSPQKANVNTTVTKKTCNEPIDLELFEQVNITLLCPFKRLYS